MKVNSARRGLYMLATLTLIVGTVAGGMVAPASAAGADEGAFSKTKTVTREFRSADGVNETVDRREVTLKVDHTKNLRGRERVKIAWSGARPSGARAADPYGENGLNQEYPLVLLQCRGIDNPKLPAAQQIQPETCFTSTRQQRSQTTSPSFAVWRHDLYATEANRGEKSGLDPIPAACKDIAGFSTHVTPFKAASGKVYPSCTGETMPPEAAVGASFPPSEVAAFTGKDGKGEINFEVRSAVENESLGCTDDTPCSIVAIPIMGLSCIDADRECRRTGRFEPGSSNFANDGIDAAVSPVYWWSESNWRNRISVPLTFALPPDVCDVVDNRTPVDFYGSELMSQATMQWAPAYCLNKKRFTFQHTTVGDAPAFKLVETGSAAGAFVSGTRERSTEDPIGYAPTALTGFAVAYVVDKPNNAGEQVALNLNPRLIAKLLTQSYTGSSLGAQHPGLTKNPMSLNQDPEFKALNPGLDSIAREAGANMLSLSESSDVIQALTEYLQADPEAKAFIAGKVDPWGMVVNPSYKGIELPVHEYPLLDEFQPKSEQKCRQENPAAYFGQLAAPVSSLRKIAEAVLDAWPNVQTKCERPNPAEPYKVGRIDRQGVGARFMLGVVSLGDAQRYGLRTAKLQTQSSMSPTAKFVSDEGRTFIAPTVKSISAAARIAKPGKTTAAFSLPMKTLRDNPEAYPGTMIVYTTAKLRGLPKPEAKNVSSFIKIATTEGQVSGSGNGRLPDGFVPITKNGATAALYERAQDVAALVEAQKEAKSSTKNPETQGPTGDGGSGTPADGPAPDTQDEPPAASAAGDGTQTLETSPTAGASSRPAQVLLPLLLVLALLAGLGGPASRLIAIVRARK